MTEMRESAAGSELVESNSILVSSQDAGLVIDTLARELGVLVRKPDEARDPDNPAYTDSRLGLTLLDLVPPDELGSADLKKATENAPDMFVHGGGEFALDAILGALRTHFRSENAGWAPTLGKNRTLAQTIEGGVIIRRDEHPPLRHDTLPDPSWVADIPGASAVRVGLMDTPFTGHPWLDHRVTKLASTIRTAADRDLEAQATAPNWRVGHSTFLAGLIAAQAPAARIVVANSLTADGTGSSWDFARRIADFAEWNANADADQRVTVLNISSGAFTYDGREPLAIATAVAKLGPEVVVVAAAGNHGDDERDRRGGGRPYQWKRRPLFPAACAPVIAVGSSDRLGKRSAFSPDAPWIDVLVPGEKLVSTYLTGPVTGFPTDPGGPDGVGTSGAAGTVDFAGFATWSGTSFATALVSGIIAARVRPDRSARQAWREIRRGLGPDKYLPVAHLLGAG